MQIGKVPNDLLDSMILKKLKYTRKEVLTRPNIGEDCCAVDFGDYVCVLSMDPITGTDSEIGKLAVNISCNDIASAGVEPLGLMVTILAPPETTEEQLGRVMSQLSQCASSINVDILGGHTEITSSVTRFVVVCTALGRANRGVPVSTGGAKAGDSLIITKFAGMEGTAIIAFENEAELEGKFGRELVDEAKSFMDKTSVVAEGVYAGSFGVSAMHDVTEGGILGAVWEMCEASCKGAVIYREQIPISMSTLKFCEYYEIDPLKLMSSGCMLIASSRGDELACELRARGIPSAVIGTVLEEPSRHMMNGGILEEINPPGPDELYGVKTKIPRIRDI